MAISLAYFKIVLAAVDFSSLYDHIAHQKKFGAFVSFVTKSLFLASKPLNYRIESLIPCISHSRLYNVLNVCKFSQL